MNNKNITGRQKNISKKEFANRKAVRVKKAKGLKASSQKWIQRQINDPYVKEAHKLGYRCRSAFKLLEIEEKFKVLKKNSVVVDLGSAPGSWCQIAVNKCGKGNVIGIDLLPVVDIDGADILCGDFISDEMQNIIKNKILSIKGTDKADIVMSDMAANTTGFKVADHLRTIALVENAYEFAKNHLAENGVFIAKVFMGGAENELLADMKKRFSKVKHFKPKACRSESVENYLIAIGFKAI